MRLLLPRLPHNLDDHRTALAPRMVRHFAAPGEDSGLVAAGRRLYRDDPRLWEIAEVGHAAKERHRAALDAEAAARDRN